MINRIRVLIVDDDAVLQRIIAAQLQRLNYEVVAAASGAHALRLLENEEFDVMLLDVQMPEMDGLETLARVRTLDDSPQIVMLTADASLHTGLEAMRRGANDYLIKPASLEAMEAVIEKAAEKRRLVRQNSALQHLVAHRTTEIDDNDFSHHDHAPIVYASPVTARLVQIARTSAQLDSTVLITGESGTGKEVFAAYIHEHSRRAHAPLITVNCGALPETLFESEFFGHERGSFTGATSLKRGLLEAADDATLFLDEVGELPTATQSKLLRFLEQGRFRRIGATRDSSSNVRIIAATNRRLEQEVTRGNFRADLFYRLNVIALHLPPLRERREDIAALLDYFLQTYRTRFKRNFRIDDATRSAILTHEWQGNVRELRNALERAAALANDDILDASLILPTSTMANIDEPNIKQHVIQSLQDAVLDEPDALQNLTLPELERRHILHTLSRTDGNRERAAALLGISARTLYRKLKEYESAV